MRGLRACIEEARAYLDQDMVACKNAFERISIPEKLLIGIRNIRNIIA